MSELLRCPFCGGEADYIIRDNKKGAEVIIFCKSCSARYESHFIRFADDKEKCLNLAFQGWNRRTNNWIKITDDPATLPKEAGYYPVLKVEGRNSNRLVKSFVWFNNEYFSYTAGHGIEVYQVKYWFDLPQPPKGDTP